jgi:Co/Zn/Cd efflux system component
VIGTVVWHAIMETVPEPITMGVLGMVALIANAACAALLHAYRDGDANMQSVWICSPTTCWAILPCCWLR